MCVICNTVRVFYPVERNQKHFFTTNISRNEGWLLRPTNRKVVRFQRSKEETSEGRNDGISEGFNEGDFDGLDDGSRLNNWR